MKSLRWLIGLWLLVCSLVSTPAVADSVPGDPTGCVLAMNELGQVTLSWSSNPEPDVLGYNVYRASNTVRQDAHLPPVSWDKLNDLLVQGESYFDADDFAEEEFFFWYFVTAADRAGNESTLPPMQGDNVIQGGEPCDGTAVPTDCSCDLPNLTMTCCPVAPLANPVDLAAVEIDYGQLVFSCGLVIDELADGVPDEITTLMPLRQTTRVEGNLEIRNHTNLGGTEGLDSVAQIDGDLYIVNNGVETGGVSVFRSLVNLIDGPGGRGSLGYRSVGGLIIIQENPHLTLCNATALLFAVYPECSDPELANMRSESDPVTYPWPDDPDYLDWREYCCEGHQLAGNDNAGVCPLSPAPDDGIFLETCWGEVGQRFLMRKNEHIDR